MDSLVGDSVLDETNASSIRDSCCRRIPASTIQFTPFRSIPTLNASNAPRNQRRPLRASPGPKSVAETPEILLVYGVEDRHHRLLYDFVFQRRDADRPLPTVRFLQINPPRRLCPVTAPVHPFVQISQPWFQSVFVFRPSHARPLPAQRHVSARNGCPAACPRSDGAAT